MAKLIEVPEGKETTSVYLIQYDEDLWYKWNDESREYCKETWIKRAESYGVEEVVLKLFPDELLPMHGHERPYIAWRHKFTGVLQNKYEIRPVTVRVRIPFEIELTVPLRTEILIDLRDKYPIGTKYEIFKSVNKVANVLVEGEL